MNGAKKNESRKLGRDLNAFYCNLINIIERFTLTAQQHAAHPRPEQFSHTKTLSFALTINSSSDELRNLLFVIHNIAPPLPDIERSRYTFLTDIYWLHYIQCCVAFCQSRSKSNRGLERGDRFSLTFFSITFLLFSHRIILAPSLTHHSRVCCSCTLRPVIMAR